jgi:hypothetical protein
MISSWVWKPLDIIGTDRCPGDTPSRDQAETRLFPKRPIPHPRRVLNKTPAKPSLKKYRPIAARNEDKKVFSGLL